MMRCSRTRLGLMNGSSQRPNEYLPACCDRFDKLLALDPRCTPRRHAINFKGRNTKGFEMFTGSHGKPLNSFDLPDLDHGLEPPKFDDAAFEGISEATLEYISDYMDQCIDAYATATDNFDVVLSQGVLTVKCGSHGTYVINKQGPNKQIWLSSPSSGPKRYDWHMEESQWQYREDTLTSLLTEEFGRIFRDSTVDFYFLNPKIKQYAQANFGGTAAF